MIKRILEHNTMQSKIAYLLKSIGLCSIEQINGVKKIDQSIGDFEKMAGISKGRDTATGYFKMN